VVADAGGAGPVADGIARLEVALAAAAAIVHLARRSDVGAKKPSQQARWRSGT
jgi:hypothetical protein